MIGPMLNQIATGGGTKSAILVDTSMDVSQVLRTKLAEIRTKAISCEYKLPATGVDFKQGQRQLHERRRGSSTIGHATIDGTDGTGCDARGGWYYDKDPSQRHADQDHRVPGDLLDVPDRSRTGTSTSCSAARPSTSTDANQPASAALAACRRRA